MNYKHSCVIDADGYYNTLVLVLLEPDETGQEQENIQYYTLKEGERLVDATRPTTRPHAGATGLIRPRWNGESWEEGAAADEIAAWDAEHPEPEPDPPSPQDLVIAQLMREVAAFKGGSISV